MSLLLYYSAGIALVVIVAVYGNIYWEKAKYQRIAKEYIQRKKMEKEASNKLENTPANTPERIPRFSSSRRSTKSMMQLPGLGQESPFRNSPTSVTSRKTEQLGSSQYGVSQETHEQSRHNVHDQSRSISYNTSRVSYPSTKSSVRSNGLTPSLHHPVPLDLQDQTPSGYPEYHTSTPNFTPTKSSSQAHHLPDIVPLNSLLQINSNDIQFKIPRAVAKDTPRPMQNGSTNMPQLRHAYAPSSPSPLNFPVISRSNINSANGDSDNTDRVHNSVSSEKDKTESKKVEVKKAENPDTVNSNAKKDKEVDEMQIDKIQDKEKRSSKKRPAENGSQTTPSIRRKKPTKSKKVNFLSETKTPSSVRKGAVPVAIRKAMYEGDEKPLPASNETKESQASKRKLSQNENEINPEFLPDHGFNWIGGEPKGKRIKLDKDTIVRKRIEYFRSLGVEVPTGFTPVYKPSTDSPTLQKLREGPRIKIREDAVSNRGRMAFSTPKKSRVDNELWKVDDDELDEMTMKRLEGGGNDVFIIEQTKKTVTFESDISAKENLVSGETKTELTSFGDKPKADGEKPQISFNFPSAAKSEPSKDIAAPSAVPTFNFAKPADEALSKDLKSSSETKTATTLFNFGGASTVKVAESLGSKPTSTDSTSATLTAAPASTASKPLESSASSFNFNTAVAPTSEKSEKEKTSEPIKPLFNFGSEAVKSTEASKPIFNFGGDASKTAPAPAFNFGGASKPAEAAKIAEPVKLAEPAKPAGFSFGADSAKPTDATKPTFTFGTSTSKPAESVKPAEPAKPAFSFGDTAKPSEPTKPATFTFGDPKPADPAKLTNFGGNGGEAANPSKPVSFQFGSDASKPVGPAKPAFGGFGATQLSEPSKPAFTFGSSAPAPAPTTSSSATFSFPSSNTTNASASINPPAFGGSTTPAFNANTSTNATSAPVAFGQSAASTGFGKPSNPSPAFGTSGTSQPFGSAAPSTGAPAFGAASSSTPAAPSTFQFGAPQTSTPAANAAPTGFSFGTTSTSFGSNTTSSTPAFGQSNNSTANAFGQAPATGFGTPSQPAQQANAFGALAPSTNTFGTPTPAANTFGQTSSQPAGGFGGFGPSSQTTSSVPAFGQPQQSNQPSPAFNFGASQQPPTFGGGFNTPSQPGSQFQFGQSTPSSTPGTTGFQFGASAGTPQFAAQPQAQIPPGRIVAQPKFRRGPKGRR